MGARTLKKPPSNRRGKILTPRPAPCHSRLLPVALKEEARRAHRAPRRRAHRDGRCLQGRCIHQAAARRAEEDVFNTQRWARSAQIRRPCPRAQPPAGPSADFFKIFSGFPRSFIIFNICVSRFVLFCWGGKRKTKAPRNVLPWLRPKLKSLSSSSTSAAAEAASLISPLSS